MRYLWLGLLLALSTCAASLPRELHNPEAVDKLLNARQTSSAASSSTDAPAQSATSINSAAPFPTTSSVASLTTPTNDATTTVSVVVTSTRTSSMTSPTSSSSSSSTQSSTSTHSSSSETTSMTPTSAPLTDINVPFYQSKYYAMIIALCCFAVGLLIAFIVSVVIALRARSDVGDLRDRLNRYEEQMYLSKQEDSTSYVGYAVPHSFGQRSYGRVSTNDSDSTLVTRSRQPTSTSGGQREFGVISPSPLGQGTKPKSRSQTGQRRVTFSDEGPSTDEAPLLSSSVFRDSIPQYAPQYSQAPAPKPIDPYGSSALAQSPPQFPASPPPQTTFESTPFTPALALGPRVNSPTRVASPPIRRLPATPDLSSSEQDDVYANPFPLRKIIQRMAITNTAK
ncbi:hypothetical protein RHS01_07354 [Rhizoctonia solani]|uniref:Transmembrane protein n=1 Tax=Rhizoctonia solani TaxID=456999 RepID=A0A8H7I7Q0_9AGAM|nr:hypothetical protein RHS01_07354 [Rhizoctonia solani]